MEEEILVQNNKDVCKVYAMGDNEYRVYLTEEIVEQDYYIDVFNFLSTATSDDHIYFEMNGYGGLGETAKSFRHYLLNTQATTYAVIVGNCMSAHSIIAVSCDELIITAQSTFMLHNYKEGFVGKANEIYSKVAYDKKFYKRFFNDVYKGFLSKKEIKKLIRGEDIYLDYDAINNGWARVLKIREKEQQEYIESVKEQQVQNTIEYLESQGYKVRKELNGS